MSEINLRRLEIFRAVYSAGSVSGAARQLRIAQPSVSRHLKYFESQIGLTLFNLVKGRIHPTSDAHRLFDATTAVFDQVDHIGSVIEDLKRGTGEQLRLISLYTLAAVIVPKVVTSITNRWPDVAIEIQSGNTHQQLAALRMGTADVGFSAAVNQIPGIHREAVGREHILVAVHRSHPLADKKVISLNDFNLWPCVNVAQSGPVGALLQRRMDASGIAPKSQITARFGSHILHLVKDMESFGLIGSLLAHQETLPEIVIRPLAEEISYDLHILWNVGRTPNDLMDYLKKCAVEELKHLPQI